MQKSIKEAMMKFTDSHCHLDFAEFSSNLPELLQQCQAKNIHRLIVPGVNPEHWQRVLSLVDLPKKNPDVNIQIACALGIHPWFLIVKNETANTDLDFQTQQLEQAINLNRNNLDAIGECGIDVFKAKKNTASETALNDNIQLQQDFFEMQLSLAKQNDLPVIVHHCQSHQLIQPLLKKHKLAKAGVIHAFSGSYQQAKDYVDLGFKLGIGGTITYPRAKKTINAIKRLPLSSLLLETDAPAMPPSGQQGVSNTPVNLIPVFNALVAIRDECAGVIAAQVEANVDQLFFSA